MVALYGRSLTRGEVEASAGQLSQFAGVQLLRYEDGPAAGVRVL